MKAYKGFNKDMTCRGFQYKEGGEYETDRAVLCESGFHACENPLDCMKYYSPNDGSVYHEVEVSGNIERANEDSKVAATAGYSSNAEVRGKESIAAVLGKNCKARGGIGCWLVLTERDDEWHILCVRAVRVDGENYKADTWYTLKDGEIVEVKED